MKRPARRRFSRWASIAVAVFLALLYAANKPFYSGSSLGEHLAWRMEHGRLTVKRSEAGSDTSFYIAANSEGLRYWFDADLWSTSNWSVTIPLWVLLLLAGGWVAWAWRPSRRSSTA